MAEGRLFIGVFPAGLVYADRLTTVNGDYRRLAFLPYSTLEPQYERVIDAELGPLIEADVAAMQARHGQDFQVSTAGQTVRLGGLA